MISILKLPVILRIFLNCIVSQVDKIVFYIFSWKLLCWCTNIALFEEINVHWICYQRPNSYVEFSIIDKKRLFYIFLYDKGASIQLEFLRWATLWLLALSTNLIINILLSIQLFWSCTFRLLLFFFFVFVFLSFFYFLGFFSFLFFPFLFFSFFS